MEVREGQVACLSCDPLDLGQGEAGEDAIVLKEGQDSGERGPRLWTEGGRGYLWGALCLPISVSVSFFCFSHYLGLWLSPSDTNRSSDSLSVSWPLFLSPFSTLWSSSRDVSKRQGYWEKPGAGGQKARSGAQGQLSTGTGGD